MVIKEVIKEVIKVIKEVVGLIPTSLQCFHGNFFVSLIELVPNRGIGLSSLHQH